MPTPPRPRTPRASRSPSPLDPTIAELASALLDLSDYCPSPSGSAPPLTPTGLFATPPSQSLALPQSTYTQTSAIMSSPSSSTSTRSSISSPASHVVRRQDSPTSRPSHARAAPTAYSPSAPTALSSPISVPTRPVAPQRPLLGHRGVTQPNHRAATRTQSSTVTFLTPPISSLTVHLPLVPVPPPQSINAVPAANAAPPATDPGSQGTGVLTVSRPPTTRTPNDLEPPPYLPNGNHNTRRVPPSFQEWNKWNSFLFCHGQDIVKSDSSLPCVHAIMQRLRPHPCFEDASCPFKDLITTLSHVQQESLTQFDNIDSTRSITQDLPFSKRFSDQFFHAVRTHGVMSLTIVTHNPDSLAHLARRRRHKVANPHPQEHPSIDYSQPNMDVLYVTAGTLNGLTLTLDIRHLREQSQSCLPFQHYLPIPWRTALAADNIIITGPNIKPINEKYFRGHLRAPQISNIAEASTLFRAFYSQILNQAPMHNFQPYDAVAALYGTPNTAFYITNQHTDTIVGSSLRNLPFWPYNHQASHRSFFRNSALSVFTICVHTAHHCFPDQPINTSVSNLLSAWAIAETNHPLPEALPKIDWHSACSGKQLFPPRSQQRRARRSPSPMSSPARSAPASPAPLVRTVSPNRSSPVPSTSVASNNSVGTSRPATSPHRTAKRGAAKRPRRVRSRDSRRTKRHEEKTAKLRPRRRVRRTSPVSPLRTSTHRRTSTTRPSRPVHRQQPRAPPRPSPRDTQGSQHRSPVANHPRHRRHNLSKFSLDPSSRHASPNRSSSPRHNASPSYSPPRQRRRTRSQTPHPNRLPRSSNDRRRSPTRPTVEVSFNRRLGPRLPGSSVDRSRSFARHHAERRSPQHHRSRSPTSSSKSDKDKLIADLRRKLDRLRHRGDDV